MAQGIPQIIAKTNARSTPNRFAPTPNVSNAETQGLALVRQAVGNLTDELSRRVDAAAKQKEALLDATQGIDLYNQAATEIEDMTREAEKAHLQALQSPQASSVVGTHVSGVNAEIKKTVEKYIKQSRSPEVAKYLGQRLGTLSIEKHKQAGTFEDAQMLNWSEAVINTNLRSMEQQAITASTDEEAFRIMSEGLALSTAVQSHISPLPPDKQEKLTTQFKERIFLARGKRLMNNDPDAYLEARKGGYLEGLVDEGKITNLDKRASDMSESNAKERIRLEEKQQRDLEKAQREAYDVNITRLAEAANTGKLTMKGLSALNAEGKLKSRGDYEYLRKSIEDFQDGKGTKSNPTVQRELARRIYTTNPDITEAELDSMRNELSVSDYRQYKQDLRATKEKYEKEGDTVQNKRLTTAYQYLEEKLDVSLAPGVRDPRSSDLIADAKKEVWDRYNNDENPMAVAEEILPSYRAPLVQRRQALRKSDYALQLGKYTDGKLLDMDIASGKLSRGRADALMGIFRKYQEAEE